MSQLVGKFLANGAVVATKLATDAVETLKIKNLNVTKEKLASASVDMSKIDPAILNAANGLVQLTTSGKIPSSLLNVGAMQYKGAWAATGDLPIGDKAIASLDYLNLTADAPGEARNSSTVVFSEITGELAIAHVGSVFTVTYDIGNTTWSDLNTYINTNHGALGFSSFVTHGGSSTISTPVGATFAGGDSLKSGYFYQVSVAGDKDLGGGANTQHFAVGDAIIFDGTYFEKCPGTDLIVSVNGQTGEVVLDTDDINEVPIAAATSASAISQVVPSVGGDLGGKYFSMKATNGTKTAYLFVNTTHPYAPVVGFDTTSRIDILDTSMTYAEVAAAIIAQAGAAATAEAVVGHTEQFKIINFIAGHVDDAYAVETSGFSVSGTDNGSDEIPANHRWFSVSLARAAAVADEINNGTTNIAPSQNAVYDALQLKADSSSLIVPHSDLHTLTSDEITGKAFGLPSAPGASHYGKIILFPLGGVPQAYSVDFAVSGVAVGWNGLGMDDLALVAGDKINVLYFS